MAARNVRSGDWMETRPGIYQSITKVERVDFEDRITVRITTLDTGTWVPSINDVVLRLDHLVKVKKGPAPRESMSWEPVYSDTTNRKKPLATSRGAC